MMMTLARMYPVDTHAISSRLAPMLPIMSGSATLTIELSMTCMSAASTTATAMKYLCGSPRSMASAAGAADRADFETGSADTVDVAMRLRARSLPSRLAFGRRPLPLRQRVVDPVEHRRLDRLDGLEAI